jgi:hypothetical protein
LRHGNAVHDQKFFATFLAFFPRHENVFEQRSGSNSGILFAVRADHVIFSASHSAPNATALSMHSGTAAHPPGLAVNRVRGNILRAAWT